MNKDFMYMPVIIFMVNILNMKDIFFGLISNQNYTNTSIIISPLVFIYSYLMDRC